MNFYTHPDFWDCDCEDDYMHPISEKECHRCGMHEEDGPESRVIELEDAGLIEKDQDRDRWTMH
jgi:PHP family Zn ribbon phosphoesterase